MSAILCVLLVLLQLAGAALTGHATKNGRAVRYSNSFAVELRDGTFPENISVELNLVNLGQVGNLRNVYHFQLPYDGNAAKKSLTPLRGSLAEMDHNPELVGRLEQNDGVVFAEQQVIKSHVKKGFYTAPTDPNWHDQWSLENTGQTSGPAGLDIRVEEAWMQNVTGRGIVVAFVDDGLEKSHPDLVTNYDSRASHDFVHNDGDPTPDQYFGDEPDDHGTSCAGEVAMKKDNGNCGVGVAHNCKVGGLKLDLSHGMTDANEASALGYSTGYIQVYSNSWGPGDSGFIVDAPGTLLSRALQTGVSEGRGGKGSIYLWAAGNGGGSFDSCAADGYASSIYTIAVGAADQTGAQAYYDEECSGKMVVTFCHNSETFGRHPYDQITTTALNGGCTDGFTGTSASTPLVSGVVALTLQANPELTWRDVQYLIAYTSNTELLTGGEWTTNGAGLKVSHKFGFGAIDAEAMVTRGRSWTNVPPQLSQTITGSTSSGTARRNADLTVTFTVPESNTITFLEHVVVEMTIAIQGYSQQFDYSDYNSEYNSVYYWDDLYEWLESPHTRRGDVKIELVAPSGTKSVLLPYRNRDFINEEGYDSWPFMSVHHWGENPSGQWTLKVFFKSTRGNAAASRIKLKLYGVSVTPQAVLGIPAECDSSCARGCSGSGAEQCDSCRELRVAQTLECVNTCPQGTQLYKNYCLGDVQVSTPPPPTDTTDAATVTVSTSAPSEETTVTVSTSISTTEATVINPTTNDSTTELPTTLAKPTSTTSESNSSSQSTDEGTHSTNQGPEPHHQTTLNKGAVIAGSITGGAVVIVTLTILVGVLLVVYRRKSHPATQGFAFVPLSDTSSENNHASSHTNTHTDV